MKVSVLIPVFNQAPYLAECLDSVLAQDFYDLEILVADEGSTDGTQEIIRQFAARDPRIRWWQNPHRLGLAQNHNACLRAAQGDFIKFVHSDDKLLEPTALSRMVALMDRDATISLVATGAKIIDAGSRDLRRQADEWSTGSYEGKRVIVQCLERNGNIIGSPIRTLFRRSQATRGFDERFPQIGDLEMWFHLLEQGKLLYVAEPWVAYRVHPHQSTASNRDEAARQDEHLLLLTRYGSRPWLDEFASRRMWFTQIYYLRKQYGERAAELTARMMKPLRPFWYPLYWLQHKLTQPLLHLCQWCGRRLKWFSPNVGLGFAILGWPDA
jgi:glycosyltransferase involved in cell wall biosynthesis